MYAKNFQDICILEERYMGLLNTLFFAVKSRSNSFGKKKDWPCGGQVLETRGRNCEQAHAVSSAWLCHETKSSATLSTWLLALLLGPSPCIKVVLARIADYFPLAMQSSSAPTRPTSYTELGRPSSLSLLPWLLCSMRSTQFRDGSWTVLKICLLPSMLCMHLILHWWCVQAEHSCFSSLLFLGEGLSKERCRAGERSADNEMIQVSATLSW